MKYISDLVEEVFYWCHTSIEAPTLLSAEVLPPIVLTWQDNSDNETGFNIYRSTDGNNFELIDTVPANTETYTDTTAEGGVVYWYSVQAYNDSATSDFSNTVQTEIEFADVDYGLLYNWYAATGDGGTYDIAPTGWHLPTPTEMVALRNYLDPLHPDVATNIAGGLMKEMGLIHWATPNTGATNTSGFTARGSGFRYDTDGLFTNLNSTVNFWNTRDDSVDWGGTGSLSFDGENFYVAINSITKKKRGTSIRLIKDDSTDPGYVVDYDDNIYPTVKIGTQVWMAQNLIVKHYNDGTAIPEVQNAAAWVALGTGAWCYYNNDSGYM